MTNEERKEIELTVDDLFRIQTEQKISILGREVSVILKTLGDADNRARQRIGTKASNRALKEIDDPDSLLYAERVAPLYTMSDEDIASVYTSVKQVEFYEDARRDILPQVPDPDEYEGLSGLAEKDEFERSEQERVAKEREEFASNAAKEYVEIARKAKDFRETALNAIISFTREIAAREALQVAWSNATVFYGTWKPSGKEHFYPSIEDWENANPDFKRMCFDAYLELDRASKDPNALSALR